MTQRRPISENGMQWRIRRDQEGGGGGGGGSTRGSLSRYWEICVNVQVL